MEAETEKAICNLAQELDRKMEPKGANMYAIASGGALETIGTRLWEVSGLDAEMVYQAHEKIPQT